MSVQPDAAASTAPTGDYVQSLARGLGVIRAFNERHPRQSTSDIAQRCNLSRPAARRFLLTLVELGYLSTDGAQYWLTPQVLELGRSYLSSLSLPDLAQPHLTELSATINESSSLSVLEGFDIIYVARVQVRRIASITLGVGTKLSAAATTMGRVLLAGLPVTTQDEYLRTIPLMEYSSGSILSRDELAAELRLVRSQGFCVIDHERDYGLYSAAAPIRDRNGTTMAAISVSVPSKTFPQAQFHTEVLPLVAAAADRISTDIGHTGILASIPQSP